MYLDRRILINRLQIPKTFQSILKKVVFRRWSDCRQMETNSPFIICKWLLIPFPGMIFLLVGKTNNIKVDFVVWPKEGITQYIQVSQTVQNPTTLARELAPLNNISDHH